MPIQIRFYGVFPISNSFKLPYYIKEKKMKKTSMIFTILVIAALALAACSEVTETPTRTLQPMDSATETLSVTETMAVEETTTATAEIPVTGNGTINVMEDSTMGSYLVGENGMALYINTNDTQGTDGTDAMSSCYDECATAWIPVTAENTDTTTLTVGEGLDATQLGTITRTDGTVQLTYYGWPLYTFANDTQPGDFMGNGMDGGAWVLVSPDGQPLNDAAMMGTPVASPTP
jgi:predicted lipoprotein with Yx(FWY)xxD motif